MTDAFKLKITLTPEQQRQIAEATGRQVAELELKPDDWPAMYRERWSAEAGLRRTGRSLVIIPAGTAIEAAAGGRVIQLDTDAAAGGEIFGTGAHATTQLALELLEDRLTPGDRVLDLGTGSGILAIAAARLGAREVAALDLDPAAAAAARRNVAVNGLEDVVEVREGSVEAAGDAPYDLAIANLIAPVFRKLAPELARLTRPSGFLIASGIIAPRAADVTAALCERSFEREEERAQGEWRAVALRRIIGSVLVKR